MYIKWLKFPVRDVYKMVEIRYIRYIKMVEIPSKRCVQNS